MESFRMEFFCSIRFATKHEQGAALPGLLLAMLAFPLHAQARTIRCRQGSKVMPEVERDGGLVLACHFQCDAPQVQLARVRKAGGEHLAGDALAAKFAQYADVADVGRPSGGVVVDGQQAGQSGAGPGFEA